MSRIPVSHCCPDLGFGKAYGGLERRGEKRKSRENGSVSYNRGSLGQRDGQD